MPVKSFGENRRGATREKRRTGNRHTRPIRAIKRNSQVACNRKYLSCVAEIQPKIAVRPPPTAPSPPPPH